MTDHNDILDFVRSRTEVQIPDLVECLNLPITEAAAALDRLELDNLIVRVDRRDGRGALVWKAA